MGWSLVKLFLRSQQHLVFSFQKHMGRKAPLPGNHSALTPLVSGLYQMAGYTAGVGELFGVGGKSTYMVTEVC